MGGLFLLGCCLGGRSQGVPERVIVRANVTKAVEEAFHVQSSNGPVNLISSGSPVTARSQSSKWLSNLPKTSQLMGRQTSQDPLPGSLLPASLRKSEQSRNLGGKKRP